MLTIAAKRGSRGFTLSETLIAVTIGSLVMAGVLTSFLFMARSGANLAHYSAMEKDARAGLERFGQDVRMARLLTTISASEVKLTIPRANDNGNDEVFYIYITLPRRPSRAAARIPSLMSPTRPPC